MGKKKTRTSPTPFIRDLTEVVVDLLKKEISQVRAKFYFDHFTHVCDLRHKKREVAS